MTSRLLLPGAKDSVLKGPGGQGTNNPWLEAGMYLLPTVREKGEQVSPHPPLRERCPDTLQQTVRAAGVRSPELCSCPVTPGEPFALGFCLSLKQRSELEQECSRGKPNRQFTMAKLPPGEAGQGVGRPLQPPCQPERPPQSIPGALFPKSGQRLSPGGQGQLWLTFPRHALGSLSFYELPWWLRG